MVWAESEKPEKYDEGKVKNYSVGHNILKISILFGICKIFETFFLSLVKIL